MARSKSYRESRIQQIALLLLPVVGVIALRGITFLRHPSVVATTADPEKVITPAGSDKKAAIGSMKKYLTEAIAIINTNDFAKAKQHYNEFHSVWMLNEDSFKKISESNYDLVEERMAEIKANLTETTNPNKDKEQAIESLQLLIKTLDDYNNAFR